jgi:hypothetical protein
MALTYNSYLKYSSTYAYFRIKTFHTDIKPIINEQKLLVNPDVSTSANTVLSQNGYERTVIQLGGFTEIANISQLNLWRKSALGLTICLTLDDDVINADSWLITGMSYGKEIGNPYYQFELILTKLYELT